MTHLRTIAATLITASCTCAFAQSAPSGAVKQAVSKFVQDLKADTADSQVTALEIQTLGTDLLTAASTAHQPNMTYVSELRSTIVTVRQSGVVTLADEALIAKELSQVLTSAGISQSEANAVKNDLLAIWNSSNLTKAELTQLAADIRAIIAALPTL